MYTRTDTNVTFTCNGCGSTHTRTPEGRLPVGYYGTFVHVAPDIIDNEFMDYYACSYDCIVAAQVSMNGMMHGTPA